MRYIGYVNNFFHHSRRQIKIFFRFFNSLSNQFMFFSKWIALIYFLYFLLIHGDFIIWAMFAATKGSALNIIFETFTISLIASIIFTLTLTPSRMHDFIVFSFNVFSCECLWIYHLLFPSYEFSHFFEFYLIETFFTLTGFTAIFSVLKTKTMQSETTCFRIAITSFFFLLRFFRFLYIGLILILFNWIYIY